MRWVRSNLVVSSDSFASPRWVGSCENPLPAQGGAQHVATEPPAPEQSPAATLPEPTLVPRGSHLCSQSTLLVQIQHKKFHPIMTSQNSME